MNLKKNEYGYRVNLGKETKAYLDGEILKLVLETGHTSVSIEVSPDYGLSVNFRKPLTKEEMEAIKLRRELRAIEEK